jgi:hypothetical protein
MLDAEISALSRSRGRPDPQKRRHGGLAVREAAVITPLPHPSKHTALIINISSVTVSDQIMHGVAAVGIHGRETEYNSG